MWIYLILLSIICHKVSSLRCFQCNSHVQPECLTDPSEFYVNCPQHNPSYPGQAPFCRKIYINIYDDWYKRDEERVIRECGYQRKPRSSKYRVILDDHEEIVHQCFTDGCNWSRAANGGPIQNGRQPVLMLLLLFVFFSNAYFF